MRAGGLGGRNSTGNENDAILICIIEAWSEQISELTAPENPHDSEELRDPPDLR